MAKKAQTKPATEKAAPAPGDAPKTSGILSLVLLGVAAAGASLGVAFFLSPDAAAPALSCAPDHAGETAAIAAPDPDQTYVALKELLVTIGSEPATRYLKINLSIATHAEGEDTIRSREPLLMDAFNIYLRSVELSDFEDPSFYTHLRDQLSRRAELVLGGEITDGVLITEFLLR